MCFGEDDLEEAAWIFLGGPENAVGHEDVILLMQRAHTIIEVPGDNFPFLLVAIEIEKIVVAISEHAIPVAREDGRGGVIDDAVDIDCLGKVLLRRSVMKFIEKFKHHGNTCLAIILVFWLLAIDELLTPT
jgi:hypothetical protein